MRTKTRWLCRVVWMLAVFWASSQAYANDEVKPAITVAGSMTLVSDYVWRGQSQTWDSPALQLSVEASHETGLYAGFWASNVSSQWVPGSHLETDWYAGYRNKFPGALSEVGYDLNFLYVYYPSGDFDQTGFGLPSSSPDTVEVYAAVNYQWLTLKAGRVLTEFYGWDTHNSGIGAFAGDPQAGVTGSTRGSWYVEANASYDLAEGWNLNGQLGRETIRHSTGLSWNYYKVGITRTMGAWSASLAAVGGSEPDAFKNFLGLRNNGDTSDAARPKAVLSISRSF